MEVNLLEQPSVVQAAVSTKPRRQKELFRLRRQWVAKRKNVIALLREKKRHCGADKWRGYKFTANIIGNGRTGIYQTTGGSKLNTLSQNQIYADGKDLDRCGSTNGQSTHFDSGVCLSKEWLTSRIGIGLSGLSPTPNDTAASCSDGFADSIAPQNTPVLAATTISGGFTLVGTLTKRPNEAIVVEYFASHPSGPDGKGEGEIYLGKQDVNSGATGVVNLSYVSNGRTSEFSAPQ